MPPDAYFAAMAAVEALQSDQAVALFGQALAEDPNCVATLDGLAELLIATGNTENAAQALRKSIRLAPKGHAERYMNLSQLCDDATESLKWIGEGIEILREELQAAKSAPKSKKKGKEAASSSSSSSAAASPSALTEATQKLACALCAQAEVYLNEACDEADAETRCEAAASEALELVKGLEAAGEPTLAEPYITCASLRLSQCRPEDAEGLVEKAAAVIEEAEEGSPPIDVCKACAKLLMEVGKPMQALELCQTLRTHADDDLELWYLTGCAALQAEEPALAVEECMNALAFAKTGACPPQEKAWANSIKELKAEAKEALAAAGGGTSADGAGAEEGGKKVLKKKAKATAGAAAASSGAVNGGIKKKKKKKAD